MATAATLAQAGEFERKPAPTTLLNISPPPNSLYPATPLWQQLVVLLVSALFAAAAWYMILLGEIGVTIGRYEQRRVVDIFYGRDAWLFSLLPFSMSILFYLQFCKTNVSSIATKIAGICLIAAPPIIYFIGPPA